MGFRFQKRIKLLPGIRLNLSKSGISWTIGPRGSSIGVGKRGTFANIGLPGTGLSFRERIRQGGDEGMPIQTGSAASLTPVPRWLALLAIGLALGSVIAFSSRAYFWAGCLLVACFASLVLRLKWVQAEREYITEKAVEAAKQRAEQRRARIDYLMSRHGGDEGLVARIDAGELWVGQTADQLRDAYGEPEDIDEKVMKTKRREIWKYDQVGTNRFSTKITLDDGVVAGWDKRD
jgi:hypothetical protein